MSEVRRYNVLTTVNVEQAGALTCELIESVTGSVVYASDYDALRLQLSRAKEWMQHEPRCNIHDHHFGGMPSCTCGLTEFLKEVGGGS